MRLAVQDERVHRLPAVVDGGMAHDLDHAGFRVDLHLANGAAEGVGRQRRRFIVVCLEQSKVEQADRAVGAFDAEPSAFKLQIS